MWYIARKKAIPCLLLSLICSIVISGNGVTEDIYSRDENGETYLVLAENAESTVERQLSKSSEMKVWIEGLLQNEDDIQRYAYM